MGEFTTTLSGIQYGLVKDHGNCKLQEALSKIDNIPMRDHRYAVHVFRNAVMPSNLPQWTNKTIGSVVKDAVELSLEVIDDGKLYRKCRVEIGQSSKRERKTKRQEILARILKEKDEGVEGEIRLDRKSIVSYVERFFVRATQPNSNFLYFYNCETPPLGTTSCLNGISGHLDPTQNSRAGDMPGINKSMFYIGSSGSFTELHVEDSLADSANLIHAGMSKIWLIVDRDDYTRTNEVVVKKLTELSSHVENNDENVQEACPLPLQHKDLVLTPALLDENSIRYELVEQKAGDLVFVRYGVLHQVINIGINIAEAINVGSHAWNVANDLKALCSCEKGQLNHIPTNTSVEMSVKVGKLKARTHSCDACGKNFNTKALLVKHMKDDHEAKHECEICHKQFNHRQSLKRHRKTHDGATTETKCTLCSATVIDIHRHNQQRHEKLVQCSGCELKYTRHELKDHQTRCILFKCEACDKSFKSRHSLGNHSRYCAKK